MTLGTHITVGVAAASPFLVGPLSASAMAPVGAFACAMASHYLVDMIPHWDWPIQSIQKSSDHPLDGSVHSRGAVANDVAVAIMDMSLGALAVAVAVGAVGAVIPLGILLAAYLGGVLPDALQLVYFAYKKEPLLTLQKFHSWTHAKARIPSERVARGIMLQSPVFVLPLFVLVIVLARAG